MPTDSTRPATPRTDDNVIVGVRPFFIVTSLHAAVDYYRDRLGFEPDFLDSDYFTVVRRGGAAIHLKEISPDVGPVPNRTRHELARHDAFITVTDPDALYDEVVERGATIHREIEDDVDDGLRAFEALDLDGYVLCFGRPL